MPKNMNIRPTSRPARPIIIRSKWKWLDNGLSIAKTAKHSIYDTLSVKCPHHVICHLGVKTRRPFQSENSAFHGDLSNTVWPGRILTHKDLALASTWAV